MGLREITKAAVGLSLMASLPISSAIAAPVRASEALPAAAVAAPVEAVRAGAAVQDENFQRRVPWLLVGVAIFFIGLGIYFAIDGDEDPGVSP